jgi:uncharacterized membrane protein
MKSERMTNSKAPTSLEDQRTCDARMQTLLSRLLTSMMIASALLIVAGLAMMWLQSSQANAQALRPLDVFASFAPTTNQHRTFAGVLSLARTLQPLAVVQLGVLVLLLTPLVRVVLTAFVFAMTREKIYVVLASLVAMVLALGLLGIVR